MFNDSLVRLLLLALFLFPEALLAQQPILPPAPNAAALGQYGDIGVSLYTGVPSISVPLYTVKTNSHLLDLSLSYSAGGVKVEEEASWVGLNWVLNAGGVITRTVLGNDDLRENTTNSGFNRRLGFPFSPVLPPYDSYNYYNGSGLPDDLRYFSHGCESDRGGNDTQPDVFFFNFGGYTGKFVMDKPETGSPRPKVRLLDEGSNCKVEYNGTGSGWKITTPDGYQYDFLDEEHEVQTEPPPPDPSLEVAYTSAWYLSRITAPATGEQIAFSYRPNGYRSQRRTSYSDKRYVERTGTSNPLCDPTDHTTQPSRVESSPSQSQVDGLILHKITFPAGEVEFKLSPRKDLLGYSQNGRNVEPKRITGMVVRDVIRLASQPQVTADIDFEQSYFNDWAAYASPVPPSPLICASSPIDITQYLRLKLDAVIQGIGTGNSTAHRFTYNIATNRDLPAKKSLDKDYLGYYNGAGNTCSGANASDIYLPRVLVTLPSGNVVSVNGANNNPDITHMTCGALTRITYPTGGYSQFEYEAHTFRTISPNIIRQNRTNETAPGLRIKKVLTQESGVAAPTVRHYLYTMPGAPGTSSGLQMAPYLHTRVIAGARPNGEAQCYSFTQITRSSSPTLTLGTSAQGQAIGYDFVTVLEGENGENGKTESTFDNQEEIIPQFRYVISGIPNKVSPSNGLLRKETVYRKQGQSFFKVKETINEYQTGSSATLQTTHTVKGAVVPPDVCRVLTGGNASALRYIKYYDIDSHWTRLTAKSEKVYNSTDNGFVEQRHTYTYANPAHRQLTTTESQLADGRILRTHALYPSDYAFQSGPLHRMAREFYILNAPVETYSTIVRGGAEHITAGTYTEYGLTGSALTGVQPTRKDVFRTGAAVPLSAFRVSNTPGTAQPEPDGRYYKTEEHLTYEGASGTLLTTQQPSHPLTTYLWDYRKTLPVAEVINAAPAQVAFTSFEADPPGRFTNPTTFVPAGPYNWSFDPRLNTAANPTHWRQFGGMTGRGCYRLDGGWGVSRDNLPPGEYELSFWATATPTVFVAAELSRWVGPPNALSYRLHRLRVRVTAANPGINIDAYGLLVDVDEVRLHPVGAQMTSYTYDALTRQPTSISDANNVPTVYDYDARSRLKLVRDHRWNILKHYVYHYKE